MEQLGSSSFSKFKNITSVALSMFNAAADALVLVIARVFIALMPALFRGWVLLFPKSNLSKVDNTFGHIGGALENWLLGS